MRCPFTTRDQFSACVLVEEKASGNALESGAAQSLFPAQ